MNRRWSRSAWRSLNVIIAAILAAAAILQAAPARGFLWRATDRSGRTVYLAGSIHALSDDFYPLSPAFENAYKDSNLLVEELDLGDGIAANPLQLLQGAMLQPPATLQKVLTPETYALMNRHAAATGLPIDLLQMLKPWTVALLIEALEWQKAGLDPAKGLDKHFYDRAQADRKTLQALETAEYQISRFDTMSMADQDRLLAQTLKEIDTERAEMGKLTSAWRSGDAAAVERVVLASLRSDPALYQRLLAERNRNWMPKIEALFTRGGKALVVVGAAHLVGPDGLVGMLRAKGYTVEQL